jgi:hypothetical protein
MRMVGSIESLIAIVTNCDNLMCRAALSLRQICMHDMLRTLIEYGFAACDMTKTGSCLLFPRKGQSNSNKRKQRGAIHVAKRNKLHQRTAIAYRFGHNEIYSLTQ